METLTESFEGGSSGSRIIGQSDISGVTFLPTGLTPNVANTPRSSWSTSPTYPVLFSSAHAFSGSNSMWLPVGTICGLNWGGHVVLGEQASPKWTIEFYFLCATGPGGDGGATFNISTSDQNVTSLAAYFPVTGVGTMSMSSATYTGLLKNTWYHYRYTFDGGVFGSSYLWYYHSRDELFIGGSGVPIYDSGMIAHATFSTPFNPGQVDMNGIKNMSGGSILWNSLFGPAGLYVDAVTTSFKTPPVLTITQDSYAVLDINEPARYDGLPVPTTAPIGSVLWVPSAAWVTSSSSTSTTAPFIRGSHNASGTWPMTIRATDTEGDYVEAFGSRVVSTDIFTPGDRWTKRRHPIGGYQA